MRMLHWSTNGLLAHKTTTHEFQYSISGVGQREKANISAEGRQLQINHTLPWLCFEGESQKQIQVPKISFVHVFKLAKSQNYLDLTTHVKAFQLSLKNLFHY